MKDAVLTSKCCFRTFCYKCIRDYIVTKSMCVCGVSNVLADDLVPNYTLRETISRLLDSTTSSTENGGSFVQVQDMESARQGQPKVPSPTISATSKGEARLPPSKEYSLDTKEVEWTSGGNLANTLTISLEKKTGQNADPSEATPESVSAKEAISPEGAPVPEGGQEKLLAGDQGKKKKKKKTRVPVTGAAADMQWGAYQDFGGENFSGMPLGPSAFNPYWPGGMPMGMDGYMAPFGGGMPYMGYPPGPFDVPYGGMLSQDPFAQQGYNMMHPGIPQRDLSELGTGNMGINQGRPVMSREEFEARKADVRRKREMERLSERDHSRDHGDRGREVDRGRETDRGDRGREVGSSRDVSPMKAKPRLMSQATPVDRTDRSDRSEKDRPAPSRHLSPRPKKRRASDQDDTTPALAAAATTTVDKKQKGSVFSRISFPEAGSKKGKTELSNGLKDKQERETSVAGHRPAANGHRDESKAAKGTTASSEGRRGRGHDHESSEEEYHFKRRPTSRRDTDDEGRGKKERGEHGHSHDRPKRR